MQNNYEIILRFNASEFTTIVTCLELDLISKKNTLAHYEKENNQNAIEYYTEQIQEIENIIAKFKNELVSV